MRPRCAFFGVAVFSCVSAFTSGSAQAQFDEMVRHVPDSANAIVLVNVKKLLGSPMAQEEGWREDSAKRFAGGLTGIPPEANQLVVAAQLDLRTMRPVWEVGLVQMGSAPALWALARQYGGTEDTVAGAGGLRLPDDTYLVRFSERLLGGFNPGNRQAVSRWVRGSGDILSPYLKEAIGYAGAGTEFIMALDMTDVAAAEDVQQAIRSFDSPLLASAKLDAKQLAQLLGSVTSLMVGVKFEKRAFAKIKLEFGRDASMLSGAAKPLLLAIIASRGLMIDEMEGWKAEVEGNRVMFGGYLTSSGLTRLSSLIEPPTSAFYSLRDVPLSRRLGPNASGEAKGASPREEARKTTPRRSGGEPAKIARQSQTVPTENSAAGETLPMPPVSQSDIQAIIEATQRYFSSTQHLLRDLRGRKREAKTIPQVGQWYEIYARRIDRLPLLHVDDQMIGYGGYAANRLREASLAIKGAGIRSRVGQVAAVNQGASASVAGTTFTRGLTLREQAAVRTQVRTQERAGAATSFQQIEAELDAATAEIRVVMAKKYQTEF